MARARKYRIVSFDGGGIRGIYTLVLLKRLEEKRPGFLGKADLLAGTSTGGIIALGLAAGMSVDDLIAFYRDHGGDVFADTWFDDLRDAGRILRADYDNRNLKKILVKIFGPARLRDLGKRVLIPTFDLDSGPASRGLRRGKSGSGRIRTWKPKFFHNFPGLESDGAESLVDVALRTTAAPTYFPSYQGFVDGGVVANNPSMAALAQALDERGKRRAENGVRLEDLRLLSLGTGYSPQFIPGERHNWGYLQWAKPVIDLMFDGMMGVADYQCARLLGGHYHRLAPVLPEQIAMDEVKKVGELVKCAKRASIVKTAKWLEREF